MPFIQWDAEMVDVERDLPAKVSSLTLHEELGGIDYIFADKTGTLTANIMEFKVCSVGGKIFDDSSFEEEDIEEVPVGRSSTVADHLKQCLTTSKGPQFQIDLGTSSAESASVKITNLQECLGHFWTNLSLCHEVIAVKDSTGRVNY
mmetsp:Transcript_25517/g.19271  ORF Transcript_25517/g.19271 Transcript_25517/m.19271 type:complete len:147 (-) Transcript_25517:2318-2758(-)